ncbi:hypothetical protein QYZ88_018210 [Lachnospiraceae bacterium C1.1]|nr:hypothetical protein [Lachnospiraceae bacterium C1.1]
MEQLLTYRLCKFRRAFRRELRREQSTGIICFVFCRRKTRVLFLAASNIIHTCQNACSFHARIAENMFHLLGQKNISFMNKLEIMSKNSIREKLLAYISFLAQLQNSKYIKVPLSRTQLADYLAINRSAMTRELSIMAAITSELLYFVV